MVRAPDSQNESTDHLDNHFWRPAADGQHWVPVKAGDLAGAVVVHLPWSKPRRRSIATGPC